MNVVCNVLILGFYDRGNLGDEAYKLAFPFILKSASNISFVSMDDIKVIPPGIDVIICGGGDIINDYFLKKMKRLLKSFTGRVYAVSVGIPYDGCAHYLCYFDHIFVRSMYDYNLAISIVGERNVSYCPDIVLYLQPKNIIGKFRKTKNIGLCFAQPFFVRRTELIQEITECLIQAYKINPEVEYHLLPFNVFKSSKKECDYYVNEQIYGILKGKNVPVIMNTQINDVNSLLAYMNANVDMNVCMRYHSVIFSLITNKPFVATYCSTKMKKLMADLGVDNRYQYEVAELDEKMSPIRIDKQFLVNVINEGLKSPNKVSLPFFLRDKYQLINDIIKRKKARLLLQCCEKSVEDDECKVITMCKNNLQKYLGIKCENMYQQSALQIGDHDPLDIARFICFVLTGHLSHECIWGLRDNMVREDFCFYEAIKYIVNYHRKSLVTNEKVIYYPEVSMNQFSRTFVNVDCFFPQDINKFHRSGWSYVVGGLMNIDASSLMRDSSIYLDTYVDRTFHWGYSTAKALGLLPYKQDWYGFVHHTFDTTHSDFNCFMMFENKDFLESLKYCRGLIALSKYLADNLKNALLSKNICVPVYVLYHPTEFVENTFTIEKYISNNDKSVVQIGAWLRNPYSIYELPVNTNNLKKKVLRGNEMDLYFPPNDFSKNLEEFLLKTCQNDNSSSCIKSCICRPSTSDRNKFCQNLSNAITEKLKSVSVISRLSDEAYDQLLAENIVFLNLIDCSAVNTVIECIVRNTVLLVNRLPALEELLGPQYPGFYNNLRHASEICEDVEELRKIYSYLCQLDKRRYTLDFFMEQMQKVLQNIPINEPDLFRQSMSRDMFFAKPQYNNIIRFLPPILKIQRPKIFD